MEDKWTEFVLPDESKVSVGNEIERATEFLFSPHYFGLKSPGCHEMIYNSLHKVDPDGHKDIIENVLPMGGTTMIPGFAKRLELELLGVLDYEFNVVNPKNNSEKEHMAWIGGSIVAELSTFEEMWIFRTEYEEDGPERMAKKKLLF
jgi:actin beta/gamma 1